MDDHNTTSNVVRSIANLFSTELEIQHDPALSHAQVASQHQARARMQKVRIINLFSQYTEAFCRLLSRSVLGRVENLLLLVL